MRESESDPIEKLSLFGGLPPQWPDASLRRKIKDLFARDRRCLVVLDDDPTGTQTMHDIWVLTKWGVEDILRALQDDEPCIFILTNSRSIILSEAREINREIAENLMVVEKKQMRPLTVVSRSDSTLRGHFPGEVDVLRTVLDKARDGPFDGICLIPFFPEGGRFTIDDIHWVQEGNLLIPAGQTPYAKDPIFGYKHSRLPEWIEEKTDGRIPASEVLTIPLSLLRQIGPRAVTDLLCQVSDGKLIIVNAATYRDLEVFVYGMLRAEARGKKFLFRTAAAFVKAVTGVSDRELLDGTEITYNRPTGNGLIVIGSYIQKTTLQLEEVLSLAGLTAVEMAVEKLIDQPTVNKTIEQTALALNQALENGNDAVLYTSRRHFGVDNGEANLAVAQAVSYAIIRTILAIRHEPRYVIGKGGVTCSDLATKGMNVHAARVMGQVYPGIPVWKLGPGSRWPGMPFIVFPGNVGEIDTLASIIRKLRG